MKIFKIVIFVLAAIIIYSFIFYSDDTHLLQKNKENTLIYEQVSLEANNIRSWIFNNGVFDQALIPVNSSGFEWPKGSNKYAIFTTGLTVAGYVNNQIRMSVAAYGGEYRPGYCISGTFHTDTTFKLYKVTRGDNSINNPDWANWGLMVPFGAPFEDINNDGIYEPAIDKAGVKGSAQTIFVCLTDADPTTHSSSVGFGGGTIPLGNEVHLTAWCYDNSGYQDIQFLKWNVINKNTISWDSTYYSFFCDPDLGDANDDYIGCDSTRNLEYCYNSDDMDGDGTGHTYGLHPPAVGMMFLNCSNPNSASVSLTFLGKNGPPICEHEPSVPLQAYNFMKGTKNDGTPFVVPNTNPPRTSKFTFSGDPESANGWTEFTGRIDNCGGSLTGNLIAPFPAGDRRYLMNMKNINLRMNPGDTQVVQIAQLIARGANNLNSVTVLKQLSDVAKHLCENNFIIGISPISSEVPKSFSMSQNYPNPFNPSTKIRFEVPLNKEGYRGLSLKIYNALGQEITTLVNEQLKPGVYEVDWNAANYPSGVYFYKLIVGDPNGQANTNNGEFAATKKMVLIK